MRTTISLRVAFSQRAVIGPSDISLIPLVGQACSFRIRAAYQRSGGRLGNFHDGFRRDRCC
jgi:hypothetical protein